MGEDEYKENPVRMRSLLVTLPAVVLALFNLANLVGPKRDPLAFTLVVC